MLNLKKLRTEKGISKYELCKRTGIDFHTIWKIENGENTRLFTLYKIADALGVDVKELFEQEG